MDKNTWILDGCDFGPSLGFCGDAVYVMAYFGYTPSGVSKMTEFPIFFYPLDIREHHLDSFGHVNNVAYLQFFEQARWEVITSAGFGLERILAEGVGPVVLDLNVRFRRELKCRQAVTVKSQVKEARGRIWVLRQWIEDAFGEIYSEAAFTLGLMDLKQRRLVSLSPGWAEAVGAIALKAD